MVARKPPQVGTCYDTGACISLPCRCKQRTAAACVLGGAPGSGVCVQGSSGRQRCNDHAGACDSPEHSHCHWHRCRYESGCNRSSHKLLTKMPACRTWLQVSVPVVTYRPAAGNTNTRGAGNAATLRRLHRHMPNALASCCCPHPCTQPSGRPLGRLGQHKLTLHTPQARHCRSLRHNPSSTLHGRRRSVNRVLARLSSGTNSVRNAHHRAHSIRCGACFGHHYSTTAPTKRSRGSDRARCNVLGSKLKPALHCAAPKGAMQHIPADTAQGANGAMQQAVSHCPNAAPSLPPPPHTRKKHPNMARLRIQGIQ